MRPLRHPRGLALLLLLVGLCTLHKLGNQAVWDDSAILAKTTALLHKGELGELSRASMLDAVFDENPGGGTKSIDLFRPIALWSFALAGPAPLLQHIINSLLHLLCVCLVYGLGRTLTRHDGSALFAAAWFGFAPVMLETHVWISGRFDLLCTCFGLAGVWCWRRAREAASGRLTAAWSCAAALAFLLGLLSKEPLLFALPALLAWPEREPTTCRARLRSLAGPYAAALVYLGLRWVALSASASPSELSGRELALALAHLPVLLLDAAAQLVFPRQIFARALNEDYAALGAGGLAMAALLALALGALLFRARRQQPALAFGAVWFACALAPVALTTSRLWPGFGRYLYLPAALWLPGLSWSALQLSARSRLVQLHPSWLTAVLVAYLGVCAARSHAGVYAFATDETLFRAIIAESPESSHGYGFLALSDVTMDPRARLALLEAALARAPDERRWATSYGSTLLFLGDRRAALAVAERYIRRFDRAPEFHLLAAYAELDSDRHAAAVHVLECLLQDATHHEGRDALLFLRTRHPEAEDFRKQFAQLLHEPRYAALAHGS